MMSFKEPWQRALLECQALRDITLCERTAYASRIDKLVYTFPANSLGPRLELAWHWDRQRPDNVWDGEYEGAP
jgi:hypothetical protein